MLQRRLSSDGARDIIVKGDQEKSLEVVLRDLLECRPEGRTLLEESPVQSSGSNGVVERSIQELEGTIRAMYINLRDRLGIQFSARERVVAFIPEYAAYLLNRIHKGDDGKVPYERTKGKSLTVIGIEIAK